MTRLRVAITLGTLEGIGPEVVSRALARRIAAGDDLADVVVLGPRATLAAVRERFEAQDTLDPRALRESDIATLGQAVPGPFLLDPGGGRPWSAPERPGFAPAGARLTLRCLEMAIRLAQRGDVAALVTGPIDKAIFPTAGLPFVGQTELLAARAGVPDPLMVLTNPRLRVGVLTTHLPLARVPQAVTGPGIVAALTRLDAFARAERGLDAPRLAVAGLNPHLGDGGLAGDEDTRVVAPAVQTARQAGLNAHGPIAADAVFGRALAGEFDAVLGLYHDQALIPVKLVDFDSTVNVTVGLPFWRTSPDHGTAYDLAWRVERAAQARPDSTLAALDLARRLARKDTIHPVPTLASRRNA